MHTSYFHCHLLQINASKYHLHNVESWYMIRFLTEAGAHPCWHEVTSPIPRWGMGARQERGGREERFESRGRAEWITSGHSCLDRLWKSSSLSHERKDIPPESWHTLPHTSKVKGCNCRFTFFRRHYFSCQDYMLGKILSQYSVVESAFWFPSPVVHQLIRSFLMPPILEWNLTLEFDSFH